MHQKHGEECGDEKHVFVLRLVPRTVELVGSGRPYGPSPLDGTAIDAIDADQLGWLGRQPHGSPMGRVWVGPCVLGKDGGRHRRCISSSSRAAARTTVLAFVGQGVL